MKKKVSLIISMIMAMGIIFAGCGNNSSSSSNSGSASSNTAANKSDSQTSTSEKLDKNQIINLEFGEDMASLNSTNMAESGANTIIMETQEMLVRMEKGTLKPAGAEEWKVSKDGLTWTFNLRDFNWSDGKKVTAQDYVYAVQKMLEPATACPNSTMFYCIKGAEEYNTNKGKVEDLAVKASDEKTLEISLNYPVPYFLQLMNFANMVPLRQDIYEACGETYGQDETKLVYSGPFVVEKWVKGSKIVLAKNDQYWDAEKVKLQKANINIVKEQPTKMKMFSSKNLDAVTDVRGEYNGLLQEKADKNEITAFTGFSPGSSEIIFNTQDKTGFFTNPKIRLAFSLAIDRDTYVKNINKGNVAAYGWVPYALLCGSDKEYRKEVEGPLKKVLDKDPKALYKEGLKELGLDENGEHEVTFLMANSNSNTRSTAEYYQDQWEKKLGVKVKLDIASDNATFNKCVMNGQYQVCQSGWGADYNDPINFLEMFETGCGNNGPFFSNKKYDELIAQARKEIDNNKRLEIFKEAETILIAEEAAIAPITYSKKNSYVQNYVKGLELPAFGPKYELKNAYIAGK
jgi:oligopeptide transport system substrate-binding protein